jgi:putative holliday junction resolvase
LSGHVFLGFDFGEKYIGVAVGGTHTGSTQPLATLNTRGREPDWEGIARLIGEWRPQALVVGLPLNMDGSNNPMTRAARRFGNRLKDRYNLPVHMVDERLTTRAAVDSLIEAGVPLRRHRSKVDQLAAQTILQAFLNDCTGTKREETGD